MRPERIFAAEVVGSSAFMTMMATIVDADPRNYDVFGWQRFQRLALRIAVPTTLAVVSDSEHIGWRASCDQPSCRLARGGVQALLIRSRSRSPTLDEMRISLRSCTVFCDRPNTYQSMNCRFAIDANPLSGTSTHSGRLAAS